MSVGTCNPNPPISFSCDMISGGILSSLSLRAASFTSCERREGGREGGREEGREGGREEGREGGREGEREGGKEEGGERDSGRE